MHRTEKLSDLPGITVTGGGGNEDVTFEEFSYAVKTEEGKELRLWFYERDPVRNMSGRKLKDALLKKIEEELSSKQTLSEEN